MWIVVFPLPYKVFDIPGNRQKDSKKNLAYTKVLVLH